MKGIVNILLCVAVSALVSCTALAAGGQDREDYKSAGEYADAFCEAAPSSMSGLAGALTSAEVFNAIYQMDESKAKNLTDSQYDRIVNNFAAAGMDALKGKQYETCSNTGKSLFDCYEYFVYLAEEQAPEHASNEQIEKEIFDLSRTGDFFGATGLCGQIDMSFQFVGDEEKSSASVIIYDIDDEWAFLLVE